MTNGEYEHHTGDIGRGSGTRTGIILRIIPRISLTERPVHVDPVDFD